MSTALARALILSLWFAGTAPQAAAQSPTPGAPGQPLPEVLLSRQLMQQAHVGIGDVVAIAADSQGAGTRRFRVVGMYEPTPDPKKFSAKRFEARLHLPDILAMTADASDPLSAESVGALNLTLVAPADAARVRASLAARNPGLVIESTSSPGAAGDPFAVLDRFHWAIAIVTVAGSTAFLLALMVMRADERREIVGILRMIGISPRSILVEILFEGLLIAVAGALFGIVMAIAAQGLVNRFFQWRYDTTLVFVRVTASIVWKSALFSIPLGVLAGVAASWTLFRRAVVALVRR